MIDAIYFDGQTTRRHPVTLVLHKRIAVMRGAGIHQSVRLSQLQVSERLDHAPRILQFPNGGTLHVTDRKFDKMLAANRYRESRVVEWQRNWQRSLGALVILLAVLISGYQWGLPWAADTLAQHLPAAVEKRIGDEGWAMVEKEMMEPSRLDVADQMRLRRLFADMRQPRGEKTEYRLEFRRSKIGPNAFALPNGVIVMTDELVMQTRNDHAVLGVLAHELGHLQRRHSLRRLLQAVGVGAMMNLWIGDVSSLLSAVPTFLLNQKYSRDFEREADQYAIDMMRANGLPLSPMAEMFEKMRDADKQEPSADGRRDKHKHAGRKRKDGRQDQDDEEEEPEIPEYFSSHPSDAERIARLRAADKK